MKLPYNQRTYSDKHWELIGKWLIVLLILIGLVFLFFYQAPILSPLPADAYFIETIREPEVKEPELIKLKVSHYWPELGGVNCGNFVDGVCVSKMANGQRWQEWVGEAIACPKELPFGTVITIDGRDWTCRDRGGMIKKIGDTYWVDMLIPYTLMPYGSEIVGEIK